MAQIKRNLEQGGGLYVSRWMTGLYTERSPLFTPLSSMGLQMISRLDTLWDGLNTDISPEMTLIRRAGFPRYCSVQFGASDYPLNFFSFKNTSGTIKPLVDTPSKVFSFTTTSMTAVFTKTGSARVSFLKVGDVVYMCNGTDADTKRWNGTTLVSWGVAAPVTAPTLSFGTGSLSPFSGYKYVYVYKDSSTGYITSASPASASTLAQTSKHVVIQGASSSNARIDKVDIYRTLDGGSIYYYLTTINNGGTWTYTDNIADTGLNDDLVAPLANINDPPPSGISLSCFHMGRVWVASGNKLYFGGGPQITNGIPEECFPPANVFVLPGKITALASTSTALGVWTEDDFYVVPGTDLGNFYVKVAQKNFGVASQKCVAQDGDMLFVFTSLGQLFQFSDSVNEIGFPIRTKLGAFDPTKVSLTLHRSGPDEGLFISNGSTDVYRYSVSMNCWSPKWVPVGGVGCLGSIEAATSDYRLLLGRATVSGYILGRSLTSFQDDGSSYSASATLGALMLAAPGQVASIKSVLLEAMPVGTYPTISILLNEVSGSFTALPNPVPDPPALVPSTTVWTKRHYLAAAQKPLPQIARFAFVQLTFATEAAANEILGLAVQSNE